MGIRHGSGSQETAHACTVVGQWDAAETVAFALEVELEASEPWLIQCLKAEHYCGSALYAAAKVNKLHDREFVAVLDRVGGGDVIRVDVSDESSVRSAFGLARGSLGPIHILANSAGLLTESSLEEETLAMWSEAIAVDLTGVFLCGREVVGEMRGQKWGRIINIASQLAMEGGLGLSHYSAAKAGMVGIAPGPI